VLVKDDESFKALLDKAEEGKGSIDYWNNLAGLVEKGHCDACFLPAGDCDHPPACKGCMWHMAFPDLDECICHMLIEEHGHCPECVAPPGGKHARHCDSYKPSREQKAKMQKMWDEQKKKMADMAEALDTEEKHEDEEYFDMNDPGDIFPEGR